MNKKKNKIDLMTEDVMMMKRMIAVVTDVKIAPVTEEIALMIEEIVPMTDDEMMIADTIVEIVHVALMTEGGKETMMTIVDHDTMMMTVTDAIDTVLVPETDILLDPTLVIAVDTDVAYFHHSSRRDSNKYEFDSKDDVVYAMTIVNLHQECFVF